MPVETITQAELPIIHLRNAGIFQPAPRLEGFAQSVSDELKTWPGVISATHWRLGNSSRVDGAEFHVDKGGELGHIHLDGEVHIALTKALRDRLIALSFAQPLVWDKAWVTAPVTSPEEAQQAVWLFRLGYNRLCSTPEGTPFRRNRRTFPESSSGIPLAVYSWLTTTR